LEQDYSTVPVYIKLKKLVIISHTDHQKSPDGSIVGWGPTINEINHIAPNWMEVVHIACFDEGPTKGTSIPYTAPNMRFVPIPPFGGSSIWKKLNIIWNARLVMQVAVREVKNASHVQLRLPMGIGLYLLPYFAFFRKRDFIFWVKYANNWVQKNPPIGYGIQRWFLKNNFANCKVTINGHWPGQQQHCLTFENPCLTTAKVEKGKKIANEKLFLPPFKLLFVGRLEDEKGVDRILNALSNIDPNLIEAINFIGDGPKRTQYESKARHLNISVNFLGLRTQEFVHKVMEKTHFLLLPTTASEGFPKVVAEACCFGCIPIVSDVSSISQYVHDGENGFITQCDNIQENLFNQLLKALHSNTETLRQMSIAASRTSERFTFEYYMESLIAKVF
jgi:glycosyltransferase involved in cell wall biosynthesis